MSVRYIFPNHPYVGYSLHDVDWIDEHLAPGWYISALWTRSGSKSVVELVKIYNKDKCWHFFHNPEEQWLILTDDGVPFDFFESQLDMEVAAQELADFKTGRLTAVHVATVLADAGRYRFLK